MANESRMAFPYHYDNEADSYTFYRVPKLLFTEPVFDCLSSDAKLLYGILLDRMQLSIRNGWVDDDGEVFIYYTVESVMEALTCGNKKAGSLLAELDEKHGIGLITRIRQGLGKPDRIYVRKCVAPEMSKRHFKICQNDTSGYVETTLPEMSKRHANNTDINETDISETDLIYSGDFGWDERKLSEQEAYRDYFRENCLLDELKKRNPYSVQELDEILELLVDVVCMNRSTIRICGDEKPVQVVKNRFMKLDSEHIQYVLDCLHENTTKVRNIKQYLLAALYNAPMTISNYYQARVQHDLYGEEP